MSKFEVGQKVEVVNSSVPEYNGKRGEITALWAPGSVWEFNVKLEDGEDAGFDEDELAPAAPQPDAGADAANPFTWSLPAEMVTKEVDEVLHMQQQQIVDLQSELAMARARIEALETALAKYTK